MRKIYLFSLSAFILIFATSSIQLSHSSSNGIIGYTGAPGSFGTCASCHSGGTSGTSGITITAVPAFTNSEYMPDSTYQVTVTGAAAGYGRYGFAAEILNTTNTNAGTLTANAADGVKTGNMSSQRRQVIHTTAKVANAGDFKFTWKAPASGKATIYTIVNAVNGNGNTGGDFPLTPVSLSLEPMPAPVDTTDLDTTSIREYSLLAGSIRLYPSPATSFVEAGFTMNISGSVQAVITDVEGRVVRKGAITQVFSGNNKLRETVEDLSPGMYFFGIRLGETPLAQKAFVVR